MNQRLMDSNSGEAYMMLFMQYTTNLIKTFQNYCKRDDIDIKADFSVFNAVPVYATNEELEDAMAKVEKVVAELITNKPAKNRKLRNIGLVMELMRKVKNLIRG